MILWYCKSFTAYQAYLKYNNLFTNQETNTYIAVTLKEIWRVACADFIPFQANYSFTDIWFGVIGAFRNYNISSGREEQKQKQTKENSNYRIFGWTHVSKHVLQNYSHILKTFLSHENSCLGFWFLQWALLRCNSTILGESLCDLHYLQNF